jgi:cyclophilin family peptidyl-prolyl cis-trans isomerase
MTNGLMASGHWVVPPGRFSWNNPAKEYAIGFDRDRKLVAAWVHIHPFAETMSLRAYDLGSSTPREVFCSHIKSFKKGVGLIHIDTLSIPQGIPMPASSDYEVAVTYNNTSGRKQDAMATMGLYMTAPEWRMPEWALTNPTCNLFCGITARPAATAVAAAPKIATDPTSKALFRRLPPFTGPASAADKPYRIEMATSKGTIVFRVEPSWAPKTAAALKPLFEKNLYAGRNFFRAEPGFVVQTPEISPESLPSADERNLLHRLPAEISDEVRHEPGVLSMARWESYPESATSSFSFILGSQEHLDGKYTIFAKVEHWDETSKIFQSIIESAQSSQPATIISTRLLVN